MTSLYKTFGVDKGLEQEGILLNYGGIRIKLARAGGSNQRFKRLLQAKLKPYRHQMDNDTMDESVSEELLRETYAATVVLGWETKVGEVWEPWIETPEGKLQFSIEACVKVLKDLPELFREIQNMTGKAANFRAAEEEADAKN